MDVRSCKVCKKLFSPIGAQIICANCLIAEEEEFQKVREYLKENKGADINMVSEETGVSVKKILRYLKEGKVEVSDTNNTILECEKCGKRVRSGRFCQSCIAEISKKMSSAIKKPAQNRRESSGMQSRHKDI